MPTEDPRDLITEMPGMTPAEVRKAIERQAEKVLNRFLRTHGFADEETFENSVAEMRGVTKERDKLKSELEGFNQRTATEKADLEKRIQELTAAVDAEKATAQQLVEEAVAEHVLRNELLSANVKPGDMDYVLSKLAAKVSVLSEEDAAKYSVQDFLAEMGTEAPMVFVDGKVPVKPVAEVVETPDNKVNTPAVTSGDGTVGEKKLANTVSGPMPPAGKPSATQARDYSKAPVSEVNTRLQEVLKG